MSVHMLVDSKQEAEGNTPPPALAMHVSFTHSFIQWILIGCQFDASASRALGTYTLSLPSGMDSLLCHPTELYAIAQVFCTHTIQYGGQNPGGHGALELCLAQQRN